MKDIIKETKCMKCKKVRKTYPAYINGVWGKICMTCAEKIR